MRRKHLVILKIVAVIWIVAVYLFFTRQPSFSIREVNKGVDLSKQLDVLEEELSQSKDFAKQLLNTLKHLKDSTGGASVINTPKETKNSLEKLGDNVDINIQEGPILPILLISCNRDAAIRRSLNLLLKFRPSQKQFPIIVSQDCGHAPTRDAILSYGNLITYIEQPDLSDITVPLKEKKFKGYFFIARHYKFALDKVFNEFQHEAVIIMEDDLEIAPDFFEYFSATYPLLRADPSLWCVSAWNDNGKKNLVDAANGANILYRTDFFPGLGWMMTRELWEELEGKWPKSYWDDWMRAPEQRKDRACIRPEISRTHTFGKKGVSNGLFYEKHLKFMYLNEVYIPFSKLDLSFLLKENYDVLFTRDVQKSQLMELNGLKTGNLPLTNSYKLIYHTKENFKRLAKSLGLMDDFKSGVPRGSYKGIIPFFYDSKRVYLSPGNNWKGYDPSWS